MLDPLLPEHHDDGEAHPVEGADDGTPPEEGLEPVRPRNARAGGETFVVPRQGVPRLNDEPVGQLVEEVRAPLVLGGGRIVGYGDEGHRSTDEVGRHRGADHPHTEDDEPLPAADVEPSGKCDDE